MYRKITSNTCTEKLLQILPSEDDIIELMARFGWQDFH